MIRRPPRSTPFPLPDALPIPSVTISAADVASGLTLHAADDDTAAIALSVTASTNDSGNVATSAAQTINLTVNPVAETPTLIASATAADHTSELHSHLNISVPPPVADSEATS